MPSLLRLSQSRRAWPTTYAIARKRRPFRRYDAAVKLIKPSPGLIAEFKAMVTQLPRAEPRKMFGYDAAFVNGNMAVGLWQNTCVVKVSAADGSKLLASGKAIPFAPMKGRVMTGWLELSEELAHDPEELLAWAERAVAFVATLPPKVKNAARQSAKTKVPTRKPPSARKAVTKKAAPKQPRRRKP
jgi:TfoX/Sxy family transcriptional regulator of competence genes